MKDKEGIKLFHKYESIIQALVPENLKIYLDSGSFNQYYETLNSRARTIMELFLILLNQLKTNEPILVRGHSFNQDSDLKNQLKLVLNEGQGNRGNRIHQSKSVLSEWIWLCMKRLGNYVLNLNVLYEEFQRIMEGLQKFLSAKVLLP